MNWTTLISDLLANGWTQARIATDFDKPQSWVSDVLRGRYRDLRWSDGNRLIHLHKREMARVRRRGKRASTPHTAGGANA